MLVYLFTYYSLVNGNNCQLKSFNNKFLKSYELTKLSFLLLI